MAMSGYGFQSIDLGHPPVQAPPPVIVAPKLNYAHIVNIILNNLYKSAPKKTSYWLPFLWRDQTTVPSQFLAKQLEAKLSAFAEINKIRDGAPGISNEKVASDILDAHHTIALGCVYNELERIQEGLNLIAALPIEKAAKKALLNEKVFATDHQNKLGDFGFLGFVSSQNNLAMIEAFLVNGANPNVLSSEDNLPVFFLIAANISSWATPNNQALIPYETLKKHLKLYIQQGFDISARYNNKNVLQYAWETSRDKDINYNVYMLEHSIVESFSSVSATENQKQQFIIFCQQLQAAGIIKFFPKIAAHYHGNCTYKSENEKNYYELQNFLNNLLSFCLYESYRINNYLIESFKTSAKAKSFDAIISHLKDLKRDYFHGSYSHMVHDSNLILQFVDPIQELLKTIPMQRISLFASASTSSSSSSSATSNDEWKSFYEENKRIIDSLDSAGCKLKDMTQPIFGKIINSSNTETGLSPKS